MHHVAHGRTIVFATLAAAALVLPNQLAAQFTIYTDATSFTTAVGSFTVEDFEDLTLAPGLSSITSDATSPFGEISGGVWSDRVDRGFDYTEFAFSGPISAFGGFWDLGPGGAGEGLEFSVLTGGGSVLVGTEIPNTYTGEFWGFTSTTSFTKVTIGGGTIDELAETYDLDDLHYSSVVPEPATILLLATGLGVVGVAARRRRERDSLA